MIQRMLAIWSLVPLPFINPAWTSGSSWFMYYWSLAWRILSITLLPVRWVQLCSIFKIVWHCLSLGLEWTLPFSVLWPLLNFQICCHIECSTLTSSFRIRNSSAGILSPPLALFVVTFPKACLTLHSRMSGSRWVITPLWLSGLWRSFSYSSSVYSCHLFLLSSTSVRSIPFLSFYWAYLCMKSSVGISNFLERSLVFLILLFTSISLHWSLREAFLSLLAILWNSAFRWVIFSPLPFSSLLFSVICKASPDNHFAFLYFFFLSPPRILYQIQIVIFTPLRTL